MTGSPNTPQGNDVLPGRGRAVHLVDLLLDTTPGPRSLLFCGPTGIGKTALLNRATAMATARGLIVLRSAGIENAPGTPFSGLTGLLDLLLERAAGDPVQDERIADVTQRCRSGDPMPMNTVVSTVLSVLRHTHPGRDLLIAVDDLNRMDPASCQALCLLGARLDATRSRMIAMVRAANGRAELHGLPLHTLEPLDESASRAVLLRHFPLLSSRVRQHILNEACGNPLALMELPLPLTSTQREVAAALPPILPLTERLQEVYRPQVAALPPDAQDVLLATALEGTGDLSALTAFTATTLETALKSAEDAHLAGVDPGGNRLVFRHPLARATVVALASPSRRRAAHRRLADAFIDRPELYAWHLSQSVIAADSTTADLVHDAAMKAMSRGALVSAVRLMTRSTDLTADPRQRARRLGYAATMSADGTGDLDAASRLVRDAREDDPDFDDTLPAIVVAATMFLHGDGDTETAFGLLTSALRARSEERVESVILLKSAFWTLLRVCLLGGRADLWDVFLRLVDKYRRHLTAFEIAAWQAAADPARANAARLAVIDEKIASAMTEKDPTKIVRLAGACASVDRLGEMRAALRRVAETGGSGHQPTTYAIRALNFLCGDALAQGRWSDVDTLSRQVSQLCATHDQRALSWPAEGSAAILAAIRGDIEQTRTRTRAMIAWAVPRDARVILVLAAHARMLEALGAADFEAACQYVAEVGAPDLAGPTSIEQMQMSFDVVYATVHTERHREAEMVVRAMHASEMPSLSPRLALHTAAAAALVASRATASGAYEWALSLPGARRWPYDRARVQLAYGEHLRRVRATHDARRHLRIALNTFQDLGARPWATRAKAELRAAGDRDPAGEPEDSSALTPQELAIVRLAADGLTNKQIGQRLFLSPRTVGNHLYRVFPKLGITSRASLRDALDSLRLDTAGAPAQ